MKIMGALLLSVGTVAGFAAIQDPADPGKSETWETRQGGDALRLPNFPWQALSSMSARKANFWIGADGRLLRYSVHVERAALPDWVRAMADERLGAGQDLDYEMERYPDGSEVYEVYRNVDGRERQLSVKSDRSLYYIGTELDAGKLPAAVARATQDLKGFMVEKCVLKEGPTVAEYHLKASVDGVSCRIRVSRDGRLVAVQRKVPAEIEIPMKP